MLSYITKRLLLMVPTFFGILIINFVVLRMNGATLTEQMMAQTQSGGAGARKVLAASRNIENYIDRFRNAGNDLPAMVNLRGFWTEGAVVKQLRLGMADSPLSPGARSEAEKGLWLAGHFAMEPLARILADDSLASLHPAASMAFRLCGYTTLTRDTDLGGETLEAVEARNETLYSNSFEAGDPQAQAKRAALLALYDANRERWRHRGGQAWRAVFVETGFVDLMTKLFTARLWSESRQEYAFTIIGQRWYISAGLNITSIVLAWMISIPLGIRAARRNGSLEERATTNVLFLLWSMPSFFVGTLLLHWLCTRNGNSAPLFPNLGLPTREETFWYSTPHYLLTLLWHTFLPLVVLTYASFTSLSRYMRGNLLDQLSADYIRTARAKGCSDDRVVYGHAVKNSMFTMITLASGLLASLFGGFVIVEYIFSIPGLGSLLLDAARQFDAPLVIASTVVSVVLLLVGILVADLLYGVVDPRVRALYV
jgi:peptide/nickel transport system permease protein